MERPWPRPTGIFDDSSWTGTKDPRQNRREGNREGAAQARSVCDFVLIRAGYRGVHELANTNEKLAFFSGLRARAQAFAPRSSGKAKATSPSLDGGTARVLRVCDPWFVWN